MIKPAKPLMGRGSGHDQVLESDEELALAKFCSTALLGRTRQRAHHGTTNLVVSKKVKSREHRCGTDRVGHNGRTQLHEAHTHSTLAKTLIYF